MGDQMGNNTDDDVVQFEFVIPASPGRMKLGFNYPWSYHLYGAQIGPNPWVSWQTWLDEQKLAYAGKEKQLPLPSLFKNIDRNLDHLAKMGFTVVRWFLLGNGFNYGLGGKIRQRAVPPPQGFYVWRDFEFDPPLRPDPRFAYHFEELLKKFKVAGLQLIPSFIDFGFIADFDNHDPNRRGSRTSGRRIDCILDPNKRLILLSFLSDLVKVPNPILLRFTLGRLSTSRTTCAPC